MMKAAACLTPMELVALLDASGASYRLIDNAPEGQTDGVSAARTVDAVATAPREMSSLTTLATNADLSEVTAPCSVTICVCRIDFRAADASTESALPLYLFV